MGFLSSQFQSRVARRLFLEFVLVLFVPLVALTYLGLSQATRQLERQTLTHLALSAKDASMSLLGRLQACELDVEMLLGDFASTGTLLDTSANPRLNERLRSNFTQLALHLPQGELEIIGSVPALPELTAAEAEHLAKGALTLVSREENGAPRLLVLRNIDAFGVGAGTLVGELKLGSLLPVEGTQGLALLHEGRVLHTTNPEVFTPAFMATLEPLQGRHAVVETSLGPYLTAAREIFLRPQFGIVLTLMMGTPEEQAIAPIVQFRTLFFLTALLAFLLVFFVGLKRVQKNLVPVALLKEATRRVASGDLDSRLEIRTRDEFQELGEAFNSMADGVRQRTRQLVEANAAKSRFLANMSHEIRTPMNSILGYADLCFAEPAAKGELREHLDVIRSSGKHLLRVIRDILDVSRIEAGKVQVELRLCSPTKVLEEAVRMVEPQLRVKTLDFESHVRGSIPFEVNTDPDRLRQVLVNLLSNAVKFTQRGKITVAVELRTSAGAPCLAFEVADTGPGIEASQLERLFQPFVQADDSMSRQHGGTGLGLFIARSLARMLGGEITCQSRVGQGSTFTVTIDPGPVESPRLAEPPAPVPAMLAQIETSPLPPGRVLVVEDVRVNRLLVVRHLRSGGFLVDEAENGGEAVGKALAAWRGGEPFSLIVMDMQMPVMDGYEATATLRASGYDGAILALTAHAIGSERERCLECGCDELATKPIDRARLLDVARQSLRLPSRPEAASGPRSAVTESQSNQPDAA